MTPDWLPIATGVGGLAFSIITAAITYGAMRQKVADLVERLKKCEAELSAVQELKTQVAVLGMKVEGEVRSLKEMSERDTRELRHDVSGLRMSVEKLSDMLMNGVRSVAGGGRGRGGATPATSRS